MVNSGKHIVVIAVQVGLMVLTGLSILTGLVVLLGLLVLTGLTFLTGLAAGGSRELTELLVPVRDFYWDSTIKLVTSNTSNGNGTCPPLEHTP